MQRNILIAAVVIAVAWAAGYALLHNIRQPETAQAPEEAPAAGETQQAALVPDAEDAPAQPAAEPTAEPQEPELPSLDIVRVLPGGEAVIAGGGPANAQITLLRNGEKHAQAIADDRGDWQMETLLPVGRAQLSLLARLVDGREVTSAQSVVVNVAEGDEETPLVVLRETGEPSRIVQEPVHAEAAQRGELALKVLDYSEDGGLILSGTGEPGATLRVYLDNALLGDVQIGENGAWTFRTGGGPVPPGLHRLRLDQLDAGGNVIGRIEEPFRQADPETIANLKPGEVIVQPGNSLWRISRRIYGKGIDYTVIYLANAGQIRDPDLIYPGQVFTIPQR